MVDWVFVLGFGAFTVIVHLIVVAVALIGAGKPARQHAPSGDLILEYGAGARILAIALGMFPVPIILVAVLVDFRSLQEEARTWLFILSFFLLFSLPFTIEFFGVSHRLTQQGIRKGSPWSPKFLALWQDFVSVRYSVALDGYVVRTAKGTIRLSKYLRGINDFRSRMAKRELEALEAMFAAGKMTDEIHFKKRNEIEQLYGVSLWETRSQEEPA